MKLKLLVNVVFVIISHIKQDISTANHIQKDYRRSKNPKKKIEIIDENDKLKINENYVRKIIDFDDRTIMLHPKINDCFDEINRFINMYISDRINDKRLD